MAIREEREISGIQIEKEKVALPSGVKAQPAGAGFGESQALGDSG